MPFAQCVRAGAAAAPALAAAAGSADRRQALRSAAGNAARRRCTARAPPESVFFLDLLERTTATGVVSLSRSVWHTRGVMSVSMLRRTRWNSSSVYGGMVESSAFTPGILSSITPNLDTTRRMQFSRAMMSHAGFHCARAT